jgi:hypothetical protein
VERLNFKKLKGVEDKNYYCVEISNRFTALGNLDTEVVIIRGDTIRENIKI